MKVALVYDRVNKWGGAERVLLALHKIWPNAPLYTAVYDKHRAPWADVFDVRPSFLGNLPHEFLPWITPMAFESFRFDEYDVVISVTSAEAKGIITKPQTLHICYCLTPTRYLWSGKETYEQFSGLLGRGLRLLAPTLRRWDEVASTRPDHYIAISKRVKDRIKKYYHRDSEVIYPPVNVSGVRYQVSRKDKIMTRDTRGYFLVVSRLVRYKRVDIIIDAFNELGLPLVIIGDGMEKQSLKERARENITFIDTHLTDEELRSYYGSCRALIHAADEDFGIVSVEALAAGKPVISYSESAVTEVIDKETGITFDQQTKYAIMSALKSFETIKFDPKKAKKRAQKFGEERFTQEFIKKVDSLI